MQTKAIVGFIVIALIVWYFLLPIMGVAGLLPAILTVIGISALLRVYAKWTWAFPWKVSGLIAIIILGLGLFLGGFFTTFMAGFPTLGAQLAPGEQIVIPVEIPAAEEVAVGPSACVVSGELLGKSANIYMKAWDQEANAPYSAMVDMGDKCYIYKNGNTPQHYIKKTAWNTQGNTTAGFAVGDTIYIYCGGDTYYASPVEGVCVDTQDKPVEINIHTIQSESNMQITGYDDTGATALSAGTASQEDYYITQGAGAEDTVYLKLKNNAANKAYDHCAWATLALDNLTSFEPASGEGYTKVTTPLFLDSIALAVNETLSDINRTVTYTVFKAATTTRMHEWDSVKVQFVAKSHATNDPVQSDGHLNNNVAYYVAISIDCQYGRGADGKLYYDFYNHTDVEDNVGLVETLRSPLGKQVGTIIEAR